MGGPMWVSVPTIPKQKTVAAHMLPESSPPKQPFVAPRHDPWWVRWSLTAAAVGILSVLVLVPLVSVFAQAFTGGVGTYFENLFGDSATRHSILLTLAIAPTTVAMNLMFGLAAAWAIARFRFFGRTALITLIDLPFSISPVVAGLLFTLLFGMRGYFGPWLESHGISILFNTPGLVIATTFVTLPFVARELIPLMESLGPDEELAAVSLGASARQVFWHVTLPNIRWGLLYGVILCNARAMGEFGAVSVLSGHITGRTDTMPLRVEKLFQEFNLPGSFAVASVLTLLAVATLLLKVIVERKVRSLRDEARRESGPEIGRGLGR
jgi:sulfate transport system permease protein